MQLSLYQHFSDYNKLLEDTRLSLIVQLSDMCISIEARKYDHAAKGAHCISKSINQLRLPNYCDNHLLNGLLFIQHQEMRCLGIAFQYTVELGTLIPAASADLCRIVSNLMDNAIEAACQIQEKCDSNYPPVVQFTCVPTQGALVIKVKNPYIGALVLGKNGFPFSSKSEPCHGKGLENIDLLVQRYNGTFRIEINSQLHIFTAIVTLLSLENA